MQDPYQPMGSIKIIDTAFSAKGPISHDQRFFTSHRERRGGLEFRLQTARGDMAGRVGDVAFKALTAGLGIATIYLAATFSVNVYRGFSWHSAQTKLEKEKPEE
ncbi:hypothetical protein LUZ62_089581 [Rhynchospora pubera]|uniref:Cytochrome c oxidase assembly protein COX20, mitochondrial n=1 Tax=Rhynchospora pubera TaxID=906938 RepID=A0AAV8CIY7_9POAL|nr:hypothetical protein LUZ62_089581 [Rhynchospora pubera]